MKILIASDCHTFQTGGISRVVASLISGLLSRGHEVKVLSLSDRNESFRDGYSYYIRSYAAFYYPEQRLSFARRDPLLDELIAWRPDIIHLHTEGSCQRFARNIAKKLNIPIVMTAHTNYATFIFGRFFETPPVKLLAWIWGKMTYHDKAAVVVPSEKARSFGQFAGVKTPITVIPNSINPAHYNTSVTEEEKAALFRQYGLTDNGHTLVMVTRVSKEKNVKEILEYFPALLARVPDAQLIIAGDGPLFENLQEYSAKNGLSGNILFTGRIPPDEVHKIYSIGNVYLSASFVENHSISYLEALIFGLPLVCHADDSLIGVLYDGRNGFIYHSKEEFTDYTAKLLSDSALCKEMGECSLQTSKDFTEEIFTDRHLALYEKVLRQWGRAGA